MGLNLNEVIAKNQKRLRQERGLSLGRLAEQSGVSKVMLSQIEKGESSPTINTLWKIAGGLQVSYTRLIDEEIEVPALIQKKDSTCVDNKEGYRVYHYCTANTTRDFEFFNSELDGGCRFVSEGHGVSTQEYLLVTLGEMTLLYGEEAYTLKEGDFIRFDSTRRHTYENRTDKMAVFTNIVYYT